MNSLSVHYLKKTLNRLIKSMQDFLKKVHPYATEEKCQTIIEIKDTKNKIYSMIFFLYKYTCRYVFIWT